MMLKFVATGFPPQRGPTVHCITRMFRHLLHRFLPYSRNSKKEKEINGE